MLTQVNPSEHLLTIETYVKTWKHMLTQVYTCQHMLTHVNIC